MKCECSKDEMVFRTMNYLSIAEKCGRCKKEFDVKHLNVPEYLITFDASQKNQEKQPVCLKGGEIYYNPSSAIRYSGNGKSGHYVCHVFWNGEEFIISDSYVSRV